MKIGLWSDCHNFPSLPSMKLSAYHKQRGDSVSVYIPLEKYDIVYASKVFSFTPDIDEEYTVRADELIKGGTGYCITVENGREIFNDSKNQSLPDDIEHFYPDYSLYPQYDFAVGFLTRGCPRGCGFCVVGKKEGRCSEQVAELSEFWRGQKLIKLLDPNILACNNHEELLRELSTSGAKVDFTQGLDIRLTNPDNIRLLNEIKTSMVHFAWDNPKDDLTAYFKQFTELSTIKSYRNKSVYVLTNYNSTIDEDLYRIYTLRDLGYSPYVMIYQKQTAPHEIRRLQCWCNNRWIFRSCPDFNDYRC
ncbi:MAG: hypothetical protein J1F28_04390 [Oscillospiraceae bacterium]|nr:hypothetical protein [Oscillospiraceae bacterium]